MLTDLEKKLQALSGKNEDEESISEVPFEIDPYTTPLTILAQDHLSNGVYTRNLETEVETTGPSFSMKLKET